MASGTSPSSVIFSHADYDRVGASHPAQFLQQSAAFTDTLIFVGCSNDGLADQNIGELLNWFGRAWGGLGKRHFALVREADLRAPGWPSGVARIAYGAKYEDLPKFISALASPNLPASAVDSAANSIEAQIPESRTFGRDEEIARVVGAALSRRPCIITGAPGMGKTKIAIAAAYSPKMIAQFGARRIFVNLEGRSDPLDMLILLAGELGLKPEPTHNSALAAIRHSCEQARAFAILDNAETLIESAHAEAARVLGLIANVAGLSVLVTSRESLVRAYGFGRGSMISRHCRRMRRATCSAASRAQSGGMTLICRR